jgi:excisionase family DNA binding protein
MLLAENAAPLVPLVSPSSSAAKVLRRDATDNSRAIKSLRQSGRQDLNLRPLGPELDSACSDGLASGGIGTQALDIIGSAEPVDPSNGIGATPDQRPFVPPVSPRNVELPERLLTVREVADHLRVCPATVYKLCDADELAHVRISNAIRVAPSDLAQFMAVHRAK